MPYIKKKERDYFAPDCPRALGPGDLNFQITCLINKYIEGNISYQMINDVIGALEGAKLEFVRRVVNPYESRKIEENGDVY